MPALILSDISLSGSSEDLGSEVLRIAKGFDTAHRINEDSVLCRPKLRMRVRACQMERNRFESVFTEICRLKVEGATEAWEATACFIGPMGSLAVEPARLLRHSSNHLMCCMLQLKFLAHFRYNARAFFPRVFSLISTLPDV